MNFNFNEEDKAKNPVAIFNNGNAGKAEGVTITALKKGVDYDGERLPDYKLKYTDNISSIEMSYYYMTKEGHNPAYGTYEDAVKKQWQKVGSILDVCGVNSAGNFKDAKEMLDSIMSKINSATAGKTFNVFANYGHVNSPKKWLQIRSWKPFVELEGTEPTTLKATKIDQMVRLTPDTGTNTTSTSSSNGWGS